jgi:peptidyl-prolyl cis-trans isomerase A (cyclophilin A)
VRRTLVTLLVACATLAASGCGGSGADSAAAGPPKALLHPSSLNATAPHFFDVTFKTTKGTFVASFHRSWAPRGVDRLYNLVHAHFFDGVEFFRVVPGFVVQFGISPYPAVSKAWQNANIQDDLVTEHNTNGAITFASAGPGTRTTQLFINLGDNRRLDNSGFAPIGRVVEGMRVVESLYSGYGEQTTQLQGQIETQGNAFLQKKFPKLDRIITARVTSRG